LTAFCLYFCVNVSAVTHVNACSGVIWFAEALEHSLVEKNANANHDCMVNFTRAFSALYLFSIAFKTKKGESEFLVVRFLWVFPED
jgi:hypothetical protein